MMNHSMKKVLFSTLVLVGVSLFCLTVFLLWSGLNRGPEDQIQKENVKLGRVFGEGKGSQDCFREAIKKSDLCSDISCELTVKYFLRGCLDTVPLPKGFCEVPERINLLESVSWSMDHCHRLGAKKVENCSRVIDVVQSICKK